MSREQTSTEPGGVPPLPARTRRFEPSSATAATSAGGELVSQAVRRAKEGDMDALHFLYVRYADDVLGYVRSFVRDHHEAEDITQNVFAKLMKAIGKYEEREVPFTAWILRVARNAALDHMRVRRALPVDEVRTTDHGLDISDYERNRTLRDALAELPADQREVLVLRHIAGLSPTEIGKLIGKTESSIHGLHHRGRRALQMSLTERGAAPVVS
jgi:RNA polymerase sigma-70 factor (ECF subfamily)